MNPNKTYIIQHKITKEQFIACSGKSSWKQPGHAKNAFNQSMNPYNMRQYGLELISDPNSFAPNHQRTPLFAEQDLFEIIELKHETLSKLEEAVELIKHLKGRCGHSENEMINKFLEDLQ